MRLLLLLMGAIWLVGCPSEDPGFSQPDDDDSTDDDDAMDDDDATDDDDAADDDDATDDDDAADDDDATPPDGALMGEVFFAGVDHDADETEAAGIELWELGDPSNSATSNADGEFALLPGDWEPAELYFDPDDADFVPRIMTTLDHSFPVPMEVTLFYIAHEETHYLQIGATWSAAHGHVLVNFLHQSDDGSPLVGAGATLSATNLGSYVATNTDEAVPASTVPGNAEASEIEFYRVDPGVTDVDVTAPAGWTCVGPETATVQAGVYTEVQVLCEES